MTAEDNVVDLAKFRDPASAQAEEQKRQFARKKVTLDELENLRSTKRILKEDQAALVYNLGKVVSQVEPENRMALTKKILGEDLFEKRKRYILFENEQPAERFHATGATFARLVEDLIAERVRKGFTESQAKINTIREVLKGTSYRPVSRFKMEDHGGDVAYFLNSIEKMLNKLGREAELQEYFDLVSKYPIYDSSMSIEHAARTLLYFHAKKLPNDLYAWNNFSEEDDEVQNWIPWWAPKCIVGNVYIPFDCQTVQLAPTIVDRVKELCGGDISEDSWKDADCSWLKQLYSGSERADKVAHHRLPVWLIALPQQDRLIACLYVSFNWQVDAFQMSASVSDGSYSAYSSASTPCFVYRIGKTLDSDQVFFSGDELTDDGDNTLFVHFSDKNIELIGSRVEREEISNFIPQSVGSYLADWQDLPPWLHTHPIQQLMKLTADSPWPSQFALQTRLLPRGDGIFGIDYGETSSVRTIETIFRPTFPEHASGLTPPIVQNTIAACILRSLVDEDRANILKALSDDARAKHVAARKLVEGEIAKFQAKFDREYGKE